MHLSQRLTMSFFVIPSTTTRTILALNKLRMFAYTRGNKHCVDSFNDIL